MIIDDEDDDDITMLLPDNMEKKDEEAKEKPMCNADNTKPVNDDIKVKQPPLVERQNIIKKETKLVPIDPRSFFGGSKIVPKIQETKNVADEMILDPSELEIINQEFSELEEQENKNKEK
jgi:hypothetical protein